MSVTFYDRHGYPIAYMEDGEHIFLFDGSPVAYVYDNAVYTFRGEHIGWFENGWVRDLSGRCAFFTEEATGSGPAKPVKRVKPVKSVKRVKPVKSVKQVRRVRSVNSLSWSESSGAVFFSK